MKYKLKALKSSRNLVKLVVLFAALIGSSWTHADLDPNIQNAPFEVVIPTGIQVIEEDLSPNASDPSIIFRITTMVSNSWFDAIAPYNATAVGVYSQLPNRPEAERTDRNRNIAIMYASYRVFSSLFPKRMDTWRNMLLNVGLDPDNNSTDVSTPIGIGNTAGNAIVNARVHDGINQLGDEGGCIYNCEPYADYTGYRPVNTAYKLRFPSRWQPAVVSKGNGLYSVQHFVTPQLGKTEPYTIKRGKDFIAPFPWDSQVINYHGYKAQADAVLQASANLTDEQKVKAEFFDHKFNSIFAAAASVVGLLNLSLEESVVIEFATNVASFDTAVSIWYNKRKYDAVRPFSAIEYIYGDQAVSAWGGPGRGTVHDMPASQWQSYLSVANHPEYPSATASFCAAHAQVMRRLHGEENLDFYTEIQAGSSRVEPGVTPASNIVIGWDNWTDLENDCGQSRLWGGVHFPASIPAGIDIGHDIGDIAYEFVIDHLAGLAHKK